jgi:hypothetical protein
VGRTISHVGHGAHIPRREVAVESEISNSGVELFASEASASYVDLSAWDVSAVTNMEQSAPHDTPPRSTHVEPFAKYGVSNVPRAAGG